MTLTRSWFDYYWGFAAAPHVWHCLLLGCIPAVCHRLMCGTASSSAASLLYVTGSCVALPPPRLHPAVCHRLICGTASFSTAASTSAASYGGPWPSHPPWIGWRQDSYFPAGGRIAPMRWPPPCAWSSTCCCCPLQRLMFLRTEARMHAASTQAGIQPGASQRSHNLSRRH